MFSKLPQLLFFLHFIVIMTTTTNTTHAKTHYELIRPYLRPFVPFPLNEFGFTNLGRIELNLTDLNITSSIPLETLDLSKFGFFLTTHKAGLHVLQQIEHAEINCSLDSHLVKIIYTLDLFPKIQSYINHFTNETSEQLYITHLSTVNESDQYTLFLANCVPELSVYLRIVSALYNLEGESGRRDYLSEGKTILPKVCFVLASTYFMLGFLWLLILWKKRSTVFSIHLFMLAVVFLEALNSLCEADHKLHIKRNGSDIQWVFVVFLFSFSKDAALIMLIVLIGAGWSFLKPFLQEKEVVVLLVVATFQFIANMTQIALEGDGPYDLSWVFFKGAFLIVDIVSCCLVLCPIVWSIENILEKPVVNLKKLTLFRQYVVVLILYMFITRVVVFALEMLTSYRYLWTSVVVGKLATLLFYIFTGYKFKPKAHYSYLGRGASATELLRLDE